MGEELPIPDTVKEHYRMKTIDRIVPTATYPSERALSRPHWSYSQLNGYLRCPLQYFFERVLKLERPFIPSNMALGSAVHEGLAEYHRRLQQQSEIPDRCVQQAFLNAWGRSVSLLMAIP
jgi:ATP-dependent helicase/DNAse subunit B